MLGSAGLGDRHGHSDNHDRRGRDAPAGAPPARAPRHRPLPSDHRNRQLSGTKQSGDSDDSVMIPGPPVVGWHHRDILCDMSYDIACDIASKSISYAISYTI